MKAETLGALEDVEPLDPNKYFSAVVVDETAPVAYKDAQRIPLYGLAEARFQDDYLPADAEGENEEKVVIAEDILNADDQGLRPVLTVAFEQPGIDDTTSPVHSATQAKILLAPRASGEIPNQVTQNPVHARIIIERAMQRYNLERIVTTPELVAGVPHDRFLNAARFLVEAGFLKAPQDTDSGSSQPTFELVNNEYEEPAVQNPSPDSSDKSQAQSELMAA